MGCFGAECGERLSNLALAIQTGRKVQVTIACGEQTGAPGTARLDLSTRIAVDAAPAPDNDAMVALLFEVAKVLESGFTGRRGDIDSSHRFISESSSTR